MKPKKVGSNLDLTVLKRLNYRKVYLKGLLIYWM
jgi:hypothetical protein